MTPVFADTSYYLALLNRADAWHSAATRMSQAIRGDIITTDFVLVEVGNALSRMKDRRFFNRLVPHLRNTPRVTIIAATRPLFDEGYNLFTQRRDKNWSLTDCISFIVMDQYRLDEALTADHHFEQAGYTVLLK